MKDRILEILGEAFSFKKICTPQTWPFQSDHEITLAETADKIASLYQGASENTEEVLINLELAILGGAYEPSETGAGFTTTKEAKEEAKAILEEYAMSREPWISVRSNKLELLNVYSEFLMNNGYMDTDWMDEPPFAIDRFMESIEPPQI